MTKRILVVDDDEMVLMALDELLKPEGYQVHTVGSGKDALQKLDEGAYDLIMTDVIMPEMDGFELCRRIREKEKYREIPVVKPCQEPPCSMSRWPFISATRQPKP